MKSRDKIDGKDLELEFMASLIKVNIELDKFLDLFLCVGKEACTRLSIFDKDQNYRRNLLGDRYCVISRMLCSFQKQIHEINKQWTNDFTHTEKKSTKKTEGEKHD